MKKLLIYLTATIAIVAQSARAQEKMLGLSETYRFQYLYKGQFCSVKDLYEYSSHKDTAILGEFLAVCNLSPSEAASKNKELICMDLYGSIARNQEYGSRPMQVFTGQGSDSNNTMCVLTQRLVKPLYQRVPNFGFNSKEIKNQWMYVSPAHPFVVTHDIQAGVWTWSIE